MAGGESGTGAWIRKTYRLYELLNDEHPILTSKGDVSMLLLLARLEEEPSATVEREEYYFDELNHSGFRKNNDLQNLSCMLAYLSDHRQRSLIGKCVSVKQTLEHEWIRLSSSCYPVYGMLALLEDERAALHEVLFLDRALRDQKFSFFKDKNFYFQTAAMLYVSDQLTRDSNHVVDPGLMTMADSIIRAQQAAQAAAMAAAASATAAASSGNGGG